MIDDFELFGAIAEDGGPVEPDVALLTAYLAGELSDVQIAAVKGRIAGDRAFAETARRLRAAWQVELPASVQGVDARLRRRSIIRIAAMIALAVGPFLAVAQSVRYFWHRQTANAPMVDIGQPVPNRPLTGAESRVEAGSRLVVLSREEAQQHVWRVDSIAAVDIGAPLTALTGRAAGGGGAKGVPVPDPRFGTSAPPDYMSEVRGAHRFDDGRIVVGQFYGGLKFFDRTGKYLRTVDSSSLNGGAVNTLVSYRGDSLLAITGSSRFVRQTAGMAMEEQHIDGIILDARGRVGRTLKLSFAVRVWPGANWGDPNSGLQGILSDGAFVFRGGTTMVLGGLPGRRIGTATYYRVSPDGSVVDSIFTAGISAVETMPARTPGGSPLVELPFFRMDAPRAAVHDQFLYWTDGTRFEVTAFDLARSQSARGSSPPRMLRAGRQPVAVTDSIRNYMINRAVARESHGGSDADASRAEWSSRPMQPVMPAVRSLLVDERGNIWLQHYRATQPMAGWPADPSDIPRWTVLDPAGRELGDVTTPRGLAVTEIGTDWILGTFTDATGAVHVRVYRLTK